MTFDAIPDMDAEELRRLAEPAPTGWRRGHYVLATSPIAGVELGSSRNYWVLVAMDDRRERQQIHRTLVLFLVSVLGSAIFSVLAGSLAGRTLSRERP